MALAAVPTNSTNQKLRIFSLLYHNQIINASTNKAHHHHHHSKMPGVVINNPQNTIRTIFSESQKSAATHRKLVNSLRTVQLTCIQQNNEQTFNEVFIKCLNRV